MAASPLVDLLLPGAGLVMRGRILLGAILLLPALLAATVLVLARVIATAEFAWTLRLTAVGAYAVLAVLAAILHGVLLRRPRLDEAALRAAFSEAAAAWLRGNSVPALAAAHRLARLAPRTPGAWRLVEMTAETAGNVRDTARAHRRRERLEYEAEES